MRKLFYFLIIVFVSCSSESEKRTELKSNIDVRYVRTAGKRVLTFLITCTNQSEMSIYTFAPVLNLYVDGVRQEIGTLRFDLSEKEMNEWAVVDTSYETTAKENRKLQNDLRQRCSSLFNGQDSLSKALYLQNIGNSIFLKGGQSIRLSYTVLDIFNDLVLTGNLTFVSENISSNDKKPLL